MISKEVKINNKTGIHARPASIIVNIANKFDAEIKLLHGNKEANLKSIISIMSLAIGDGEVITIQTDGKDEAKALEEIIDAIKHKMKG